MVNLKKYVKIYFYLPIILKNLNTYVKFWGLNMSILMKIGMNVWAQMKVVIIQIIKNNKIKLVLTLFIANNLINNLRISQKFTLIKIILFNYQMVYSIQKKNN